jgi:hypothetical protein
MEEGVVFGGGVGDLFEFGGAETEGAGDEGLDERVYDGETFVVASAGDNWE